jgi:hypothetical protein
MEAQVVRMEVRADTVLRDITDKKFLSQPKHDRRVDSERVAAPVVFLRVTIYFARWEAGGSPFDFARDKQTRPYVPFGN